MNQRMLAPVSLRVSVLIRTTGRPSLIRAIESVVLQNYEGLELLIVNASAKPLAPMSMMEGSSTTRIIEAGKVLDRASAAQVLIDAANAPYAIFLDDDDWWLAGHLAKLAQVLDTDERLVAAYTDVLCVTDAGEASERTEHVFQCEFDRTALQLSNFLPIHSVMFRMRHVRTEPISFFDPTLKLFEDWDFWLQLSQKGTFARVPGVSAVYALNTRQGSGHTNPAGSQRTDMLSILGDRQLKRWSGEDVVRLMSLYGSQINQINHLSQLSALNIARADALEKMSELSRLRSQELKDAAELSEKRYHELETAVEIQEKRFSENLKRSSTQFVQVSKALENSRQDLYTLEVAAKLADLKLAELQSAFAVSTKELQKSQQYSALQQAELEKLAALRLVHLAQISDIYRSTSWRATRFLRLASQMVLALTQRSSFVLARNVGKAATAAVSRHGFRGVISRLPYYAKHRGTYIELLRKPGVQGSFGAFAAPFAELRDMRLHPDLTGGGEMIDAKISVVIPTLNAGSEFALMLRKLRSQKSIREIEIVVVDSGSKDATVAVALEANSKVVEITKEEFSHSYARNLGADHATGDYILFMVQDAYPIGSYWMYGMLRFLLDHADKKLAAVSCSEYSRSDSDMMYDSMINTHYRFLGCLESDRIGEFSGDDHMSLRSRGQLSDVSCLITRACFQEFRYRGNYAEDLDLGIRLIKSGMRVGMLASVKVIHSHNRPAYYYLKRSFVDVIFLVGLFDDFIVPTCQSLPGLLGGILSTAAHISGWLKKLKLQDSSQSLGDQVQSWIVAARTDFSILKMDTKLDLGDVSLDIFVASMATRFLNSGIPVLSSAVDFDEARKFGDSFIARLDHFKMFATEIYGAQDDLIRQELGEVVRKTFAAAAGSALAFYCLGHATAPDSGQHPSKLIHEELAAGV